MTSTQGLRTAAALALALLIAAPAANAQYPGDGPRGRRHHGEPCDGEGGPGCGPHGGRAGGPHGKRGPHGAVIEQLLNPCGATCREQAQICHKAAEAPIVSCGETACAAEITAAQSVCPAGAPPNDREACHKGMDALLSCMKPCFENQRSVMEACRETAHTCKDACRNTASSQQ